jgi:streptomycin 6-kinase
MDGPAGASESVVLETLAQRLSVFSDELNINRERLAQWSFCHAVLSALWDFEESAEWRPTMKLAETLAHLC